VLQDGECGLGGQGHLICSSLPTPLLSAFLPLCAESCHSLLQPGSALTTTHQAKTKSYQNAQSFPDSSRVPQRDQPTLTLFGSSLFAKEAVHFYSHHRDIILQHGEGWKIDKRYKFHDDDDDDDDDDEISSLLVKAIHIIPQSETKITEKTTGEKCKWVKCYQKNRETPLSS